MSETLSRRVARLISGSVNALLDAVEHSNASVVMEQSLRELDSTIAEIRHEIGQITAQKHQLSRALLQENNRHAELDAQLQLAVEKQRDDLAEAAISTQMDIEARLPVLSHNVQDCVEKEQELTALLQALLAKRRDMQQELQHYHQQQASTANHGSTLTAVPTNNHYQQQADASTATFARVFQHATGKSSATQDPTNANKLAELDELSRQHRIAERLAATKAEQGK
jgi:phage shock protein A